MTSEDRNDMDDEFDHKDAAHGPEWLDEFDEPDTAPTQEWLREVATEETAAAIRGAQEAYELYAFSPDKWPNLAAVMHAFANRVLTLSEKLSNGLASFAAANPEPEDYAVPEDDGVGVLLLPSGQHADFWEYAAEYVADPEEGDPPPDRDEVLAAYGKAFGNEYGRPGMHETVKALDDQERGGAVLVFQHLTEQRGPAPTLVRVMIGGLVGEEDRIHQVLEENGVVPGPPAYWPPVPGFARFLAVPNASGVYDQFGRPLDVPEDAEVGDQADRMA